MNKVSKTKLIRGNPEWERWSLDHVKNLLNDFAPNLSVQQAFLPLVRDKIMESGRLDDGEHCLRVIDEMHAKGELPLRPEIAQARTEAWRASQYVRSDAYDAMLAEE